MGLIELKLPFLNKEEEELIPHYTEPEKKKINIYEIIKHYFKKTFVYIIICTIIIILTVLYRNLLNINKNELNHITVSKLDKIIHNYYKNSTIPNIEDVNFTI